MFDWKIQQRKSVILFIYIYAVTTNLDDGGDHEEVSFPKRHEGFDWEN